MPFITKKLKKVHKKIEKQQKRNEVLEEKRKEEEKQKEEEEKQRLEDERKAKHEQKKQDIKAKKMEAKRKHEFREKMLKISTESQRIHKTEAPKEARDEQMFERSGGFTIIRKEFASGRFSKIYPVKQKDNDNGLVVKITILDMKCGTRYRDNFIKQSVKIMRYVGGNGGPQPKAPQFVRVHDIFSIQNKYYVFMDECQRKSLNTVIKGKEEIGEENAKKWSKQVAEGINALYCMGVSHRNIRPENVIFDKVNNIIIVGFGMSCVYWDSVHQKVAMVAKEKPDKHIIERYNHLPPEAFAGEYDPTLADVWSFGVLIAQLCAKDTPFDLKKDQKANTFEQQWNKYSAKHKIPDLAKQLCDKIFVTDVTARITIADVLEDQWFTAAVVSAVNPEANTPEAAGSPMDETPQSP